MTKVPNLEFYEGRKEEDLSCHYRYGTYNKKDVCMPLLPI